MNKTIKSGTSELILNENGSVLSYKISAEELSAPNGEERPLFTIKLRDDKGTPVYCHALEAEKITFSNEADKLIIEYININNLSVSATATISSVGNGRFLWHIYVDNESGMLMEWTEFPQISVVDSLKGEGGEYELFWPSVEGVVIDDKSQRENTWWKYQELGDRTIGYSGFYPGSCPMQFMAYYGKKAGLYFAAHDPDHTPKTVEFRAEKSGIALEYRVFCSAAKGKYDPGYDMVTDSFCGDWHDAAEMYRAWMETGASLPEKICDNTSLPAWLDDSPVMLIYPVRGKMDRGDMTPNEYYPYKNILPLTGKLAEETDSKILALVMQWEGTAPWAPPYVWPPYGGTEEFKEFADSLHEQGNLAGAYCSGIGWTTYSFLDPAYDPADKYDETLICRTPDGTIKQSLVLGEPIRHGYDMCPQSEKVSQIVAGEVSSIASCGFDYIQYFDQNLGGESCFCYAKDHDHPAGPGVWQNEAMIRIFKNAYAAAKKTGHDPVIGCECAASEPFIGYLPLNDLRYEFGFFFGRPVPAYAYLFHEYLNNFMGNQNGFDGTADMSRNPDNLLFRIAYSFTAGDIITLTLGEKGEIQWDWDIPWETEPPQQQNILTLVKNLNSWRRVHREYLREGKMQKPLPLEGIGEYEILLKTGSKRTYQSLLTSRWRSPAGKEAQIIVNFLTHEQTCRVKCSEIYRKASAKAEVTDGNIKIPPLSAVLVG